MKGQIKFAYILGMVIFIAGLLFGSEIILRLLPSYNLIIRKRKLSLIADTTMILLSQDPGYWKNTTHNGTDWENNTEYIKRLGFGEDSLLNERKISASIDFNYTSLKEYLGFVQRNFFIKVVYNNVTENCTIDRKKGIVNGKEISCCNLSEVKCIGIMPPKKKDVGRREEKILINTGGNSTGGKIRVEIW